jgi:hypothetical protein
MSKVEKKELVTVEIPVSLYIPEVRIGLLRLKRTKLSACTRTGETVIKIALRQITDIYEGRSQFPGGASPVEDHCCFSIMSDAHCFHVEARPDERKTFLESLKHNLQVNNMKVDQTSTHDTFSPSDLLTTNGKLQVKIQEQKAQIEALSQNITRLEKLILRHFPFEQ